MALLSEDGRVIMTNHAWDKLSGIQTPLLWTQSECPLLSHPKIQKAVAQAFRGQPQSIRELTFPAASQTPHIGNLFLSPINDPLTGTTQVLLTLQNITEQFRLEEQLRMSRYLESLGHLAGGVAHDFNNILSVIFGYAELFRRQVPGDSPLHRGISHMITAAEKGRRIVQQLLSFSRQTPLEGAWIAPDREIRSMLPLLTDLCGPDCSLRLELHGPGQIFADPTTFHQILMNCVTNARDAMSQGGAITLKTHVSIHPRDGLILEIMDQGQGISQEQMPHLFDPFFTTKPPGKGTGLGLSSIYGMIRQHAGSIRVSSVPGRTVFSVFLPFHAPLGARSLTPVEGQHAVKAQSITGILCSTDPALRTFFTRKTSELKGHCHLVRHHAPIERILLRLPHLNFLILEEPRPSPGVRAFWERIHALHPGVPRVWFLSDLEHIDTAFPFAEAPVQVICSGPHPEKSRESLWDSLQVLTRAPLAPPSSNQPAADADISSE